MRGTRWLLLVAIAAIVGGVVVTYRDQLRILRRGSPAKPNALPLDLNSSAEEWYFEQTEGKPPFRKTVVIKAKNFKQVKETSRVDLEHVELRLYHKDGLAFDLVKSAAASFQATERKLFSDGEVEITLGVPADGAEKQNLVSIKSSGVTFDSANGRAETDRPSTFVFARGTGKATGAIYDPTTHQLEMKKEVEIHWQPATPNAKPMKIESAGLLYYEGKSEIWLREWGRMTRDQMVVEGDSPVIHLANRVIQKIEARRAHGIDSQPKRKLQYAADGLWIDFNEDGVVSRIIGDGNARLVSDAEAAQTTVTSNRVELDFKPDGHESLLTKVTARGNAFVESKPKALPGRALPETHTLRSDALDLSMREGGREMERIITQAPGIVEFMPNLPTQHHRKLEGDRIDIAYGEQNVLESFQATGAKTYTDPTAEERKRNRTLALTTSKDLAAKFEPNTNRLSSMEQLGDFTYDEGDRHARASKATLDAAANLIHLETAARVWDPTGSTAADRILMDQRTGDFTAEGHVVSSRVPEKKKSSEMLAGDEPLQAQAQKMDSANRNHVIHYAGHVVMWQGANRIHADVIDVNRDNHTLIANGNVVSQMWEASGKKPEAGPKAPKAQLLTVIRAHRLVYTDQDRLATYSGGVHLVRSGLDVRSRELRAWMAEANADSSLERAFADGAVQIVQAATGRTRTGTAEHSEYYTGDQKIILRGGDPTLVDSVRGRTKGSELTYFANDDRLLVNGVPDKPATSVIRKKK